MNRCFSPLPLLLVCFFGLSCVDIRPSPLNSALVFSGDAGINMSINFLPGDNVTGFRIDLREGDQLCPRQGAVMPSTDPIIATQDVGLFDFDIELIPGSPFSHAIADHFFTVQPGCYHITVTALDEAGDVVSDCQSAYAEANVLSSLTTELLIILQCTSEARGGLDVIATLNNPPIIDNIVFEPSKFVFECEELRVCLEVDDDDGDPFEVEWSTPAIADPQDPTCASIVVDEASSLEIYATVFDVLADGTRLHDFLQEHLESPEASFDSARFPVYISRRIYCAGDAGLEILDRGIYADQCTPVNEPVDNGGPYPACRDVGSVTGR